MDLITVIAASSVIAALVSGLVTYFSQRNLASRQARLSYEYQARQRLYGAIGPLRFQLLMASRDVVSRISNHAESANWNLRPDQYYGKSTMYRLLRPLAICTLIERRMNAADFSVDPSGIELLKFESSAYTMLTGADPLPGFQDFNWSTQTQHVFRDNLRRSAARLIAVDHDKQPYIIDFAEFSTLVADPAADGALSSLARILNESGSNLMENPVFWVRLLGYAFVCNHLLETRGVEVGLHGHRLAVEQLMQQSGDAELIKRSSGQAAVFADIVSKPL